MKTPMSGRSSVYTALLLASARCPASSHQAPVLAVRMWASDRSDSEMSAELQAGGVGGVVDTSPY